MLTSPVHSMIDLSKRPRVCERLVARKRTLLSAATRSPARPAADPATGHTGNAYSIEVLSRAISVLSAFGHARPSLSLSEMVAATGLPKTTVFRVLSSLVERDFCELDSQTGKYSLGFALVRLADIRRRQSNVHDVALPVMREIRNEANETVILSVKSGDFRVHIDFVEGLHPMRRTADLGVRAPLYAGAASKVLLAGMEDEEIEAYLERTDLTAFQKTNHHRQVSSVARYSRDPQTGLRRKQGRAVRRRRRARGPSEGVFRQDHCGHRHFNSGTQIHACAPPALHCFVT